MLIRTNYLVVISELMMDHESFYAHIWLQHLDPIYSASLYYRPFSDLVAYSEGYPSMLLYYRGKMSHMPLRGSHFVMLRSLKSYKDK